jgi:hypothetical protein
MQPQNPNNFHFALNAALAPSPIGPSTYGGYGGFDTAVSNN